MAKNEQPSTTSFRSRDKSRAAPLAASSLRYVATGVDVGMLWRTSSASAAYRCSGGTVQFTRVGSTQARPVEVVVVEAVVRKV